MQVLGYDGSNLIIVHLLTVLDYKISQRVFHQLSGIN